MKSILIKNAHIVDGTGIQAFKSNLFLNNGRIKIITNKEVHSDIIIDGEGLILSPGFIDPHTHADLLIRLFPECSNYVMQGVTSVIGGNCGMTVAPSPITSFDSWLIDLQQRSIAINYIPLLGHGTIRNMVLDPFKLQDYKRHARLEEIEKMKDITVKAMKAGAFGFSSGIDYNPGKYCDFSEIIEIAKIVKEFGGIYCTHHRHVHSEWSTDDVMDSSYGRFQNGEIEDAWVGRYKGLQEAISLARATKIKLQISHICPVYNISPPHPEYLDAAAARATLDLIDKANNEGLDVAFDIIVNCSSIAAGEPIIGTFLIKAGIDGSLRIPFLRGFSKSQFLDALKTNEFRTKIKNFANEGKLKIVMIHTKADPYWMHKFKIIKSKNSELVGKIIGEMADEMQKDALDVIFDLLLEDPEIVWVQFAEERCINDGSIPVFLQHPKCLPCSDTLSVVPINIPDENYLLMSHGWRYDKVTNDWYIENSAIPDGFTPYLNSPHVYGMYPKYIGKFIRDKNVLSLEEGIKKITFNVAQRFDIPERGAILENYWADLVLFNYDTIGIQGDFNNPQVPPSGIEYVIVNGEVIYKNQKQIPIMPGQVLRKTVTQGGN
jgi:N-acyl-D-amino-acid deacylase